MRPTQEKLKAFTERAVAATMDSAFIPPVVYIPMNLRRRQVRVAEHITLNPATEAENDLRVAQADPLGFLIAIMQGQPVPCFEVSKTPDNKIAVDMHMEIAALDLRASVAQMLVERKNRRTGKSKADYDAMIDRAAGLSDEGIV